MYLPLDNPNSPSIFAFLAEDVGEAAGAADADAAAAPADEVKEPAAAEAAPAEDDSDDFALLGALSPNLILLLTPSIWSIARNQLHKINLHCFMYSLSWFK